MKRRTVKNKPPDPPRQTLEADTTAARGFWQQVAEELKTVQVVRVKR